MSDILPAPEGGVWVPPYTQGLRTETERDVIRRVTIAEVSLRIVRRVEVPDAAVLDRGPDYGRAVQQEAVERAVRQMQEEAVITLGLNHWKGELRREAAAEGQAETRRILMAVRDAVRAADSTDQAALLIQDQIDALEVA